MVYQEYKEFTTVLTICRWLSEKYDGFRACWNYITGQLYVIYSSCFCGLINSRYSRSGKVIGMNNSFSPILPPNVFLDGEIWLVIHMFLFLSDRLIYYRFGRDTFKEALKISNKQTQMVMWEYTRFVIFDSPPIRSSKPSLSFEDRFRQLESNIDYTHPFVVSVLYLLFIIFIFYIFFFIIDDLTWVGLSPHKLNVLVNTT